MVESGTSAHRVGSSYQGKVTSRTTPPGDAPPPAFICFLVSLLISSRNYYNLSAPPLILASLLLQHKGDRLQQIRKIILRQILFFSNFRSWEFLKSLNNDSAVNSGRGRGRRRQAGPVCCFANFSFSSLGPLTAIVLIGPFLSAYSFPGNSDLNRFISPKMIIFLYRVHLPL